ncbi:MAG: Ribokinase [Micavibrio sp.]|nr:Ribokinase [Micavibrio sp.]
MIIVFGSNVLDIFFDLADLPPADTAKHLAEHVEAPGGKGANQAVAAARAGAEVRFYGALGDGGHGRQMYKNLGINKVDVSGIEILEGVPSGLATIFVDERDGTHRVVVSHGANLKAKQSTIPDKILNRDAIVLVQAELPLAETEALLVRAKKGGARTVMNLAPAKEISETMLKNLDIIVLNEHEANLLGEHVGIDTADKISFATALYSRYNLTTIVTLGPDGAICCAPEGLITVSSLKIKPVDTIGAGDAFVGYLCAGLDRGLPLSESLRHAAVAGSLACTKMGAQVALPQPEEVMQHLNQIQVGGTTTEPSQNAKLAL